MSKAIPYPGWRDLSYPVRLKPHDRLFSLLAENRLPHALLFVGMAGTGKRTTAISLAMACNCRAPKAGEGCGNCRACRKIRAGTHPDFSVIQPAGNFIRIEAIRELCYTLGMKPYEASTRVVVLAGAEQMNPEAANALLKVLEEPPDRTLMILTAGQSSDLLPTIVSRCQQFRFPPIPRQELAGFLMAETGLSGARAWAVAGMALGSFSRALEMSEAGWLDRRQWLITASGLDGPPQGRTRPAGLCLAFAEKLAADREKLSESLELLKSWLRDLLIYPYAPDRILHQDLAETVAQAAFHRSGKGLVAAIDAVRAVQSEIRANSNLRLSLDRLCLKLGALA